MTTTWLAGARRAMLTSICLSAFAVSTHALAQDAPPQTEPANTASEVAASSTDAQTQDDSAQAANQEVVVTARRRNEVLKDVPIAVTAYSGEQLQRQGALDISDIGDTTPNVTIETSRGTNSTLTAFIRGVGQQDPVAGFEQGVGLYIDDVYLNRPQLALLDIYDVERIEVLRGPQGTLYGRNTIGGAIKYVTRRLADVPEGSVRTNIGSYKQFDLVMTASAPLTDGLRIGAAVARLTHDGFGTNITTGKENYNKDVTAARGTLEFEPSDNVFFRVMGDYTWDNSNARGGHREIESLVSHTPVLSDVYDTAGGMTNPTQKVKGGGISGRLELGLGSGLTLRSITAYRKDSSIGPIDFDALPTADVDVPGLYSNKQFSQEVQLVVDKGPLQGLIGAYYLNADARTAFDVRAYTTGAVLHLPGLTLGTDSRIGTKTWAVFGDFTYDITEQFSLSLGGRYTDDRRTGDIVRKTYVFGGSPTFGGDFGFDEGIAVATTSDFHRHRKDTAFTPRASLSFKPNEDHNFYISYSRGFKGGGFDPRGQTSQAPDQSTQGIYDYMAFDPETVNSYELGWKGSAMDRRLNWALATFYADYKNVQIPASVPCTVSGIASFCGVTSNAGKAVFKGVEFEGSFRAAENIAAPSDRLTLSTSVGYLDAKYKNFMSIVAYEPDGTPITTTPLPEVNLADYRKVQNTPKWTLSGTLDYDVPVGTGRMNFNTTVSYRSSSQQFEIAIPGLDQGGFALWDANLVWRSPGSRWELGLHGKNLLNKHYILGGYNYFLQNPYTGEFILKNGQPGLSSAVGLEGTLTAFYGNPRQVFVSAGMRF